MIDNFTGNLIYGKGIIINQFQIFGEFIINFNM